ncbi:transposase [Mycobacterium sp. pV006]
MVTTPIPEVLTYFRSPRRSQPVWELHLADPYRVVIDPDPASKSGRSVRIIGYSATARSVLTVIALEDDGTIHGVNAWPSNPRDQRIYEEES